MTAAILALSTSTNVLFAKNKVTLKEFVEANIAKSVVLAIRDNGDKINGTLVFIGFEGEPEVKVGDTFNARNGQNKRPYGCHHVLAVIAEDGTVTQDEGFEVDIDTVKAAAFLA